MPPPASAAAVRSVKSGCWAPCPADATTCRPAAGTRARQGVEPASQQPPAHAAMASLVLASLVTLCAGAAPTDNPVRTQFGAGAAAWTDSIPWGTVVSVADFSGSFDKAQDALLAKGKGGGVVFFPPGTYSFKEHILLKSGVVIRGAPTADPAKVGKAMGSLAPTTRFECPDRAHLGLFNADANATGIGIVNVDLDGCAVMFWPSLGDQPLSMKSYWFEASSVKGMGSNKLVLGNRIRNVNYDDFNPADGAWGKPSSGATSPWPWPFSTAVAVYSDKNALVANNLLGPSTKIATMVASGGKQVPYPYDNRYGIDVNKVLLGGAFGKLVPGASPGKCTDAQSHFPWSFRPGLVIRDNWVYGDGRVGISFSGGGDGKTAGSGTQVFSNHVEHRNDSTFWGFSPTKLAHGSDTNENRGYDQGGIENNVTMNTGHIHRQQVGGSPYQTVDGEGLLVQCNNGNNQYRNIWADNDLTGGTSGYIAYYGVNIVQDNQILRNKVNLDQQIGFMEIDTKVDQLHGNTCNQNQPPCKCSAQKGQTCKWTTPVADKNQLTLPHANVGGPLLSCSSMCTGKCHTIKISNPGNVSVLPICCASAVSGTASCPPADTSNCSGLVPPNEGGAKYSNTSVACLSISFAFFASQPLSTHQLAKAHSPWVKIEGSGEPEVGVPYGAHRFPCDTSADCPVGFQCGSGNCERTQPPQPSPPSPAPPVPLPAAVDCNLTGQWEVYGKPEDPLSMARFPRSGREYGIVNITASREGKFAAVAADAKDGRAVPWNGTGVLSASDETVRFTTDSGIELQAVVNNTVTCGLITITRPMHTGKGNAAHWQKIEDHKPPPFDLKLLTGTYLGDGATDVFLPVSIDLLETGGGDAQVVVGGNGLFSFGLTPTTTLSATSQSNGSVALFTLKASGQLAPVAIVKIGGRVDQVSVRSGGSVAVVGDFGAALLQLPTTAAAWQHSQPVTVVWHDAMALVQRGDCGLCCDGRNRCRISISKASGNATSATTVVGIPVAGSSAIVTYSSSGVRLGEHITKPGRFITDVEIIDSPQQPETVAYTFFYNSNTGREPMVMPGLSATSFDFKTVRYDLWAWSAHEYRSPGPCDGNVADSRAERIMFVDDQTGVLLIGRSDGGNGVYQCQTRNVTQKTAIVGYDGYTESFNMQAQAITYMGRLKPTTGQVIIGSYNLVRLPTSTRGNTLGTVDAGADSAGNIYLAQTAACCIQNMANLTVNGQPLQPTGDAAALQVVSKDFGTRKLWHHFSLPGSANHTGSQAIGVAVGKSMTVFAATTSQLMAQANAFPRTKAPAGSAALVQGYLAVVHNVN